jgi:MEMO1 family protein
MLTRSRAFPSGPSTFPPLSPILVGSTSPNTESTYGALLAPYIADPSTFWVISSDFCHWGLRFRYTYYDPNPFIIPASKPTSSGSKTDTTLKASSAAPTNPYIHESIASTDLASMFSIERTGHSGFTSELQRTGNTICGRHPIGVIMSALEHLFKDKDEAEKGKFKFVRYERSSLVKKVGDSSVSYASAYAVF